MDIGRTADFDATSDRWLASASYLNVRSVTLSYTFPKVLASKAFMQDAQLYVSAENFLIKSARKGLNVQQNFSGISNNAFSLSKSIVLGISFTL